MSAIERIRWWLYYRTRFGAWFRRFLCEHMGHLWDVSFDIRICRRCMRWEANPEW